MKSKVILAKLGLMNHCHWNKLFIEINIIRQYTR